MNRSDDLKSTTEEMETVSHPLPSRSILGVFSKNAAELWNSHRTVNNASEAVSQIGKL